jgi:hypothetical protein
MNLLTIINSIAIAFLMWQHKEEIKDIFNF